MCLWILNVTYGCNDLNLVETADFPELDDIPQRQVTLREAARAQSVVSSSGRQIRCACRGACTDDVVVKKQKRSVTVDVTKLALVVRIIEVCTFNITRR